MAYDWTATAGELLLKMTVNIYFVAPENNFRNCFKDRFSVGLVTLVIFCGILSAFDNGI